MMKRSRNHLLIYTNITETYSDNEFVKDKMYFKCLNPILLVFFFLGMYQYVTNWKPSDPNLLQEHCILPIRFLKKVWQ